MKTTIAAPGPQLLPESNFRLYLQAELARRCLLNQQYSLRSFAVHLGIDHSTLSQLIRGKRPLTEKKIVKLGERMGRDRDEIKAFVRQEKLLAAEFYSQLFGWFINANNALGYRMVDTGRDSVRIVQIGEVLIE